MNAIARNIELTGATRTSHAGKVEHEYIEENAYGIRTKHWIKDELLNASEEVVQQMAEKVFAEADTAKAAQEAADADIDAQEDAAVILLKAAVASGATLETLKEALGGFNSSYISEVVYELNAGELNKAIAAVEML